MRRFWQYVLLAITGLLLMSLSPPLTGQAKEITSVTGLDANSCVIKDARGRVISHTAVLPADTSYTINYNWRIPNSARIQNGDTMSFYVPNNVTIIGDRSFPMNGSGSIGVVGTTSIKDGAHVGTVTLNGRLTNSSQRSGFIRINVKGTQPVTPTPTKPVTMTKQVNWTTPNDFTNITWKLAINLNGQTVTNPQVTDQLGSNQRYVAGSVVATSASGLRLQVAATTTGNQVIFKLTGKVTNNYTLTYRTTTTHNSSGDTFSNAALYHDDNGHNAAANASIDREDEALTPDENENPNVTPPENPNPGTPTEPSKPNPDNPITMTKRAAWVDPDDPTQIKWKVTINGNGNELVNPEVIDRLSNNQTYTPGSATAVDSNGKAVAVVDSYSGTEVSFKMAGTYTGVLKLTYKSTTDEPSGVATYVNAADYHDDNGNEASATDSLERDGEELEPEVPPGLSTPIAMTKTAAWSDPNDFTKITWQLTVTANENRLVNPTITDQLSDNHHYLAGTVTAETAKGSVIPVTATVNGQQVVFKLTGTFSSNLHIQYQTATASPTGAAIFNNAAVYEDENNNTAAADAKIAREASVVEPPEVPNKEAIKMTKSAAWATPNDFTNILWTIIVNANGNQLVNPRLTDDTSPELTYVENSAKATDSTGKTIPVSVAVNGNQLIFMLSGTFANDLKLTYTTKTVSADGAAKYANIVVYDDDSDNEASATATIERPEQPNEPQPPTTTPSTPAPGPSEPEVPTVPQPGEPEQPTTTPQPGEPEKPTQPSEPQTPAPTPQPGKPEVPSVTPQPSEPQRPTTKPQPEKPQMPATKPQTTPSATKPSVNGSSSQSSQNLPANTPLTSHAITEPQPENGVTAMTPSAVQTATTGNTTTSPADNTPTTNALPQTNEQQTGLTAILGLILLSLLAAFGIWKRHQLH